MTSDGWVVTRLAPALGARIDGVDLHRASDVELERLQALLDEHQVLALPRQGAVDVDDHIRIGEAFGDPLVHPFLTAIPEHPAILEVIKEPGDAETFGGEFWHCDISFLDPPASVSVLRAIELPPMGGDTLFSNTIAAVERLSEPIRELVLGLTATHVYPGLDEGPDTTAVHPVARRHPRTGQLALYVNPAFVARINELESAESDMLLAFLYSHQTRPEFQVRVSWEPDQLVIWDNRTTVHYAMNDYPGERRSLHRVTSIERPV
ncbi:MAG: TauD/TfdA family dioxygenase [Actinomycetota bacterium]